ncbi:nitrate- and nitrite sensing domain-containing protein [Peterkaempfera bronchialis]|uniref:sensor histidine kinase n=1 Tax=Peterkaempfera bronchialis TaxID=2126346 RepID=UPI003C2E8C93
MRFRSRSIRAKIIALLLVPIVALVGLWGFSTFTAIGRMWSLAQLSDNVDRFGGPVVDLGTAVQDERRAMVEHLVSPKSQIAAVALRRAESETDRRAAELRRQAAGKHAGDLDGLLRDRLTSVLDATDRLATLRKDASDGVLPWDEVLDRYNKVVEPTFRFRTAFGSAATGQAAREATVLSEITRAREYLSQEDAAMAGLRGSARPTDLQYRLVDHTIQAHELLFSLYRSELVAEDRELYDDFFAGTHWTTLHVYETLFLAKGGRGKSAVSAADWNTATRHVLKDLAEINLKLTENSNHRADAAIWSDIRQGVITGSAGLIAVVISVLVSVRIGRSLLRELVLLRNAAQEMAGVRLPKVMRLLRRGEQVDIATETPPLSLGGTQEINQVGRAFDAVQRTAVEAAVEQAELRRGVSAVFVNLARRNQVLLHRQLTLLDSMERRTDDPTELEGLFQLDHLTTRMRRHAEGLIILSGGSPGRNWRRPVRMVDVVRAAVGEVEDYARVTVRQFPSTALVGQAVADVTHLIAELVENATLYSPPHTQVTVHGEIVGNGFALEVDDRGLGMGAEVMAEANLRLAEEQEFDLADTDRLGLFVVSRLARRHGIKVSLRLSPYGGTTAVVLIPRQLLAEAPAGPADGPDGVPDSLPEGRRMRRELLAVPAPEPELAVLGRSAPGGPGGDGHAPAPDEDDHVGPRPADTEPAPTPGGLPRRRTSTKLTRLVERPEPVVERPEPVVERPEPVAAVPDRAPAPSGAAPAGLPRRVRQANLAPQLRDVPEEPTGPAAAARERSPEEARATLASFQRGLSRGRGDSRTPRSLVPPDRHQDRRMTNPGDTAPDASVEGNGR